jgi:hypothetical protein
MPEDCPDSNSGTKRRNKGALPLVGESELSPARIGYNRDLFLYLFPHQKQSTKVIIF